MSQIDDLIITPWHPIRINNNFTFPEYVSPGEVFKCDYVYNLVLESGHIVRVDDIECVTLGHSFKDPESASEKIVTHDYFGSQKIIEDLMKLDGWNSGFIDMGSSYFHRNESTKLVDGLKICKS